VRDWADTATGCAADTRALAVLAASQRMKNTPPAVVEASKTIGAVLEDLETRTGSEVKDIALEDVVDTDPDTGQPVVQKAVEITLNPHPAKRWSR
jgi:hypothetical protein